MRARRTFQEQLDRRIYSSFHRREWALTAREYALLFSIAALGDEWMPITQRQGARSKGYSLHGFHNALMSFRAGGLVAVSTRRGHYGWTRIRPVKGLLALMKSNVPTVDGDSKRSIDLVTTVGTLKSAMGFRARDLLGFDPRGEPIRGPLARPLGTEAGA